MLEIQPLFPPEARCCTWRGRRRPCPFCIFRCHSRALRWGTQPWEGAGRLGSAEPQLHGHLLGLAAAGLAHQRKSSILLKMVQASLKSGLLSFPAFQGSLKLLSLCAGSV